MTEKEILLTSILHCSRSALYSEDWTLNNEQEKRLFEALSLRSQGMPLQYILGEVEFFGLVFKVDKRKRENSPPPKSVGGRPPELCGGRRTTDDRRRILDIGTGSGCIAVSVAKSLPRGRVDALD